MGHHVIRETAFMKFIKLESRGGNYLVVASNIAWLRAAENGQTNVGMVGGQPLLVVGSIEEVAAKVLAGTANTADNSDDLELDPAPADPPVAQPGPDFHPVLVIETTPEAEPERLTASPHLDAPSLSPQAVSTPDPALTPARPDQVSARSASMWERSASTPPKDNQMISGSQRMMGMLE